MRVQPGFAICALAVVGCRDPTQMRLDVTTDVGTDWASKALVAFSFGKAGETEDAEPATVHSGTWASDGRIGDLVVVPSGSKHAKVGIRVVMALGHDPADCAADAYKDCIIARRQLRFLQNETLRLPIPLYTACLGVPCEPGTTCDILGRCVSSAIDPVECAKLGGEACMPQPDEDSGDGGAGGAGMGGATTTGELLDASTTTTGMGANGGVGGMGGAGGMGGVGGVAGNGTGGSGGVGGTAATGGAGGTGGGSSLGPNAVLAVNPTLSEVGADVVFDASATTDPDNSPAELTFVWNFGDGADMPYDSVVSHAYAAVGNYQATLTVSDPDGNTSVATRDVFVTDPSSELVVDIGVDENDLIATPSNPQGLGMSLREAILLANAYPEYGTIRIVTTEPHVLDAALPIISTPMVLTGGTIDGSATLGDCIWVESDDVLIRGVRIIGCDGSPLRLVAGNNLEVSECFFQDSSGSILIEAAAARFIDNTLLRQFGTLAGVSVSAPGVSLVGNLIAEYDSGIVLESGADNVAIWHNTLATHGTAALVLNSVSGVDARNNIFFDSGGFAVTGQDSAFAEFDYNLFFQNAGGDCSACTPGANSVFADPLFADPAGDDYGIPSTSPAIDGGFDLGIDRNGSDPGAFDGSAPDIGHAEVN